MKRVIIIGAGPAGLTTAYKLLKNNKEYDVTILEASNYIGGISKTIDYKGNRMDIGGHRFFTKDEEVMALWQEICPIQNKLAKDDIILESNKMLPQHGVDPEKKNNVLLVRRRISRIYYAGKFYDYPVSFSFKTISNLGVFKTIACGFSYLKAMLFKKKENNLENFYINRFGKKLYHLFFEKYTEKVWGRSPKKISAEWGSQRVKGISIKELIKNKLHKSQEVSLIEEFYYPKLGPGAIYQEMAKKIKDMGGHIVFNAHVDKIKVINNKIVSINYNNQIIKGDIFVSSMPLKDLVYSLNNVPNNIKIIAKNLPYRDFISIGVLVNKLLIKNNTKYKTINDIIPDTWIYVQDDKVKLGRIQIFNNWSPYLIKNDNKVWLGLEYFCNEFDAFWQLKDQEIINLAISELQKIKFINKDDVVDSCLIRERKAYPAYFDSYSKIDSLKEYLFSIDNLFCIGRNGQHRYNNMDHSIKTGIIAAQEIMNNQHDNDKLWSVNTDKAYQEVKDEKN